MTEEEQRLEIAKACGDPVKPQHDWDDRDDRRYFVCLNCGDTHGWIDFSKAGKHPEGPCPGTMKNYPECLNACAEMETSLNEDETKVYRKTLMDMMITPDNPWGVSDAISAKAPQRCEAFLKAKGILQ